MAKSGSLSRYRSRRDFRKTSEPHGRRGRRTKKPRFVIQMHDASSLHFDLRLEVDGVLKSWAVPKGPSPDPREKRLATPTEDHPLDYRDFEGVIPEGEYGAGTVLVWDRGTYRNLREDDADDGADMQASLRGGRIEVRLYGKKLKGGWALVRMKKRKDWLLVKMKDRWADARRNPVSTEKKSVASGRTLARIRAEEGEDA